MLLREAIEKHLKDVRREEGHDEGTINSKRSILQGLHKVMLGINTGKHAREKDGRNSHKVYMSLRDGITTKNLDKEAFLNYVDHCRNTMSPASQKKAFSHLRVFAEWLLDEELTSKKMRTNPMRKVKNPLAGKPVDKSREPRKRYEEKEVRHILLTTLERLGMFKYFFIALFFLFGRRVSELRLIQWKHIDWENRILTYWDEKVDEWKECPIHAELFVMLKAYLKWYQEHCDEYGLGNVLGHGDWFLFPYPVYYGNVRLLEKRPFRLNPRRKMGSAALTNWFNESLELAGLKVKGQATHTAKHHQVNQQVDTLQKNNVGDASKLATQYSGHARVETMETHYRNRSNDMERYREIINRIDMYSEEFRQGLPGFEEYDGPMDKEDRSQIILPEVKKSSILTEEEEAVWSALVGELNSDPA